MTENILNLDVFNTTETQTGIDQYTMPDELKRGNIVNGKVIKKTEREIILDINNKSDLTVLITSEEKEIADKLNVGDVVDCLITEIIDKKLFTIFGSLSKGNVQTLYNFLEDAYLNKKTLTGIPTSFNHAGYAVDIMINGESTMLFMPHLLTDVNKLPDSEVLVNTEISFFVDKIIKDNKYTYIANRKLYVSSFIKEERSTLDKDTLYTGYVTSTTDFGVFVQFNSCLTCLIHKSNLAETAQALLQSGEILSGMSIEFYIKDITKDKIFGTQVFNESLWDKLEVNDTLLGKIVSIKPYGLLVELDYDTRGLVHISNIKNIDGFKTGDEVFVIISNIDFDKKQIVLKLRDNEE